MAGLFAILISHHEADRHSERLYSRNFKGPRLYWWQQDGFGQDYRLCGTNTSKMGRRSCGNICCRIDTYTVNNLFILMARTVKKLTKYRELALQIFEQIKAISAPQSLKPVLITGGADMREQALALSQRPHIVIATP